MGTLFKVGIPTAWRDPCWGQNALEKVYTWNSLGPWAYKNIIVCIKASQWKKKLQFIYRASHTIFLAPNSTQSSFLPESDLTVRSSFNKKSQHRYNFSPLPLNFNLGRKIKQKIFGFLIRTLLNSSFVQPTIPGKWMYEMPPLPKYKSGLPCLLIIKADPLLVSLIGLCLRKAIKIPHAAGTCTHRRQRNLHNGHKWGLWLPTNFKHSSQI